jgi:hypothetical protein
MYQSWIPSPELQKKKKKKLWKNIMPNFPEKMAVVAK